MDLERKIIIGIFVLVGISILGFNLLLAGEDDLSEYDYDYHKHTGFGEVWVKNNILYIDNRDQCSWDYPDNASERMMVDYALDFNPSAKEALNIGLGCGLTAQRVLDRGLQLDVVEINPAVIDVNKQYSNITLEKNLNLVLNDGFKYLRITEKHYDLILVDVENPEVVHSSNLYTKEAFKLVHEKLYFGGAFALWSFDLFYQDSNFHDIMYWTLKEEFDYVYKYPDVFIATDFPTGEMEYIPSIPKQVNSLEHKIIRR